MLSFTTLWNNHPSNNGNDQPCKDASGNPNFDNQCAIRLGVALETSGLSLTGYTGAKCWFGHGHILRVEEMIKWLKLKTADVGTAVSFKPGSDARTPLVGKTGIVACRNFYGRGNQGDHIDLWDGTRMAKGSPTYMDGSEEVVFWELA
jgi:hypothetical protein